MPPRVSVIVTCFELGDTLEEALASVEAQSFRDHEIVVVDDGSTGPSTLAALEAIAPSRARVLRTENRGLPAARNHGVRHSRGELLCCLDADDRLHPEWLSKAVARLDQDGELAFVSHWLQTFGDETGDWTPTDCGFPALLDVNTVNGAALVRRTAWEAVGGQDESLRGGCEDWDFWITLVEKGHRGAILPEILFYYRRRAGSMSRALVGEAHRSLYLQLIERHPETFARHLPALWLRRQLDLGRCRRDLDALDEEWDSWLAARLDDRRSEAAAVARQLEPIRNALALAVEERAREVQALRASWSWRLTRPLRAVVGALRGE
jgi:glycosyltransferase involved in cell wall biosynthesis